MTIPPYPTDEYSITEGSYPLSYKTAYKCGNVVTVFLRAGNITPTARGWVILGTLPTPCIPSLEFDLTGQNNIDDTAIHVRIDASGNIKYWGLANVAVMPYINATYIVPTV